MTWECIAYAKFPKRMCFEKGSVEEAAVKRKIDFYCLPAELVSTTIHPPAAASARAEELKLDIRYGSGSDELRDRNFVESDGTEKGESQDVQELYEVGQIVADDCKLDEPIENPDYLHEGGKSFGPDDLKELDELSKRLDQLHERAKIFGANRVDD